MRGGHQPYKRGARHPGMPLQNMQRGHSPFLPHPLSMQRKNRKRQSHLAQRLARLRGY